MEYAFVRNIHGSTAKQQAADLVASGFPERRILGLAKESFADVFRLYRGGSGVLRIAADARVLVDNPDKKPEKQLYANLNACEKAGIRVIDIRKPDATFLEISDEARRRFAGDRPRKKDGRENERAGRKGGKKRGENWLGKQEATFPRRNVERLKALVGKVLTQRDLAWALGISITTLRKHYLSAPKPRAAKRKRK